MSLEGSQDRSHFVCIPESSRANANDRLPRASLGRVEGREGIVEERDVADVRPQSSVPHPLDNLTELTGPNDCRPMLWAVVSATSVGADPSICADPIRGALGAYGSLSTTGRRWNSRVAGC